MIADPFTWPGALPILTSAQMRAAELAAASGGTALAILMDRAGAALADLAWRTAAGRDILILAGPGNNGGDGYVAARLLAARGARVRVAALALPASDLCRAAAAEFERPVEALDTTTAGAPVIVDALFGTGGRSLDAETYAVAQPLLAQAMRVIAADVPSGLDADSGESPGPALHADVTLAFGALKPVHLLYPAAARCGRVLIADLGLSAESETHRLGEPPLPAPGPDAHKFRRGMVGIVAGWMAGATELSARAALRSGAGYVQLLGRHLPTSEPFAIVRHGLSYDTKLDSRLGALVIGPGLWDDSLAKRLLSNATENRTPVVVDAGAISVFLAINSSAPAILTPHAGEFAHNWAELVGDKLSITREAAMRAGAIVVHKGADTVIAAPDGRAAIASDASPWLATAGTGDVLAGICGAMLARGLDPFAAACAAVALHGRAAERAGPGLCADDLVAGPIWP